MLRRMDHVELVQRQVGCLNPRARPQPLVRRLPSNGLKTGVRAATLPSVAIGDVKLADGMCWFKRTAIARRKSARPKESNKTLLSFAGSGTLADMDVVLIVLGLLVLASLGLVAWLIAQRGRTLLELARAQAELAGGSASLQAMTSDRDEQLRERRDAESEVDRLRDEAKLLASGLSDLRSEIARLNSELEAQLNARQSDLKHRDEIHAQELKSLREAKDAIEATLKSYDDKLRETFGSLASEALKASTGEFLKLANERLGAVGTKAVADINVRTTAFEDLLKPIRETLANTNIKLGEIEKERTSSYASLKELVEQGTRTNAALLSETGKLSQALRKPQVRGRYGEIQLRRVAELAGMTAYCDFSEQSETRDADGNALRPDMVVRLPTDRSIVVDAKTNIEAYLDAVNAGTPEIAEEHLDRFARHVGEQALALSRKKYWSQYEGSPEFVVMFIPGDQFIDAALSRRSDLLDKAAEQGVILASPSTLIGLLRAVSIGFQEQRLAQSAKNLRDLGKELHDRMCTALAHAEKLRNHLNGAVESFNDFAGSYERRVKPTLDKFEESGVKSPKDLPKLPSIVVNAKSLSVRTVGERMLPGIAHEEHGPE